MKTARRLVFGGWTLIALLAGVDQGRAQVSRTLPLTLPDSKACRSVPWHGTVSGNALSVQLAMDVWRSLPAKFVSPPRPLLADVSWVPNRMLAVLSAEGAAPGDYAGEKTVSLPAPGKSLFALQEWFQDMPSDRLATGTSLDTNRTAPAFFPPPQALIFWQLPGGEACCAFRNGEGAIDAIVMINPAQSSVLPRAAADVNGDGVEDLVGQLPNGEAAVWFLKIRASDPGESMKIVDASAAPVSLGAMDEPDRKAIAALNFPPDKLTVHDFQTLGSLADSPLSPSGSGQLGISASAR